MARTRLTLNPSKKRAFHNLKPIEESATATRSTTPIDTTARSPNWTSGLRPTDAAGDNPKEAYGAQKVSLGLIPPTLQVFAALAYSVGAAKYGPFNWRVEPVQMLTYLEAIKRHTEGLLDGEDFDPETGIPHAAFLIANAGIILDAWVNNTLIDNRPIAGKTGELLAMFKGVTNPADRERLMRKFIEKQTKYEG